MRYTWPAVGIALSLALGSCGMNQGGSAPPSGATQLPGGSVPTGQQSADQVRLKLLAFADLSMGEMERLGIAVDATEPTPASRAFVQGVRADVASTTLALALEPDPESALQDLMVSMAAKGVATKSKAAPTVDASTVDDVQASLTLLEKEIWEIGSGLYSAAELERLRQQVAQWWNESPGKAAVGVVRIGDLPDGGEDRLTKGLFAPLNEANRQIEETRLLGERFLFLAERLPTVAIWQAEAAAWGAMAAPEAREALDGLTLIASTMETLGLRVDSLPMLLDSQREAFLSAFDEREDAMNGLLGEAGTVVRDASPLVASGERIVEMSPEVMASVSRTLEVMQELVAALRDPDAPGGGVSLDVAEYAALVGDVRAATEALSEALTHADALAETPQAVIDHATWRAVQLMLLFFALLVAYRYGIPALRRGREADG